ncbi:hypothetical protein ACO1O0_008861 [Amphichorda felina]
MGREVPSVGRPPAGFRRDARAKRAKATANQVIPGLLSAHPRARRGIEAVELIIDPPPVVHLGTDNSSETDLDSTTLGMGPRLTLQVADTLTVARALVLKGEENTTLGSSSRTGKNTPHRVAILNMASPLCPSGGFFNGAQGQEESLCVRTTLLPSLRDEYYRLPEIGAIYTPDVLIFRDEAGEDGVLPKSDRWLVDCISAAMLRHPDTERDEVTGRGRYTQGKDRDMILSKMRMVMRTCQLKGVRRVVLGAWGCGAYGNPLGEIAAAWRKVLLPRNKSRQGRQKNGKSKCHLETWNGIEEVVFAISDPGMAELFAAAFGEGLVWDRELDAQQESEGDEEGEHNEASSEEESIE